MNSYIFFVLGHTNVASQPKRVQFQENGSKNPFHEKVGCQNSFAVNDKDQKCIITNATFRKLGSELDLEG